MAAQGSSSRDFSATSQSVRKRSINSWPSRRGQVNTPLVRNAPRADRYAYVVSPVFRLLLPLVPRFLRLGGPATTTMNGTASAPPTPTRNGRRSMLSIACVPVTDGASDAAPLPPLSPRNIPSPRRARLPVRLFCAVAFVVLTVVLYPRVFLGQKRPISRVRTLIHRALPSSGLAATADSKALSWHNFDRIEARTTRLAKGGVIAPLRLRHLEEYKAPAPYDEVWLTSAWVDPRPLIIKREGSTENATKSRPEPPQVAIIAQMKGKGYMSYPSGSFPQVPLLLQCHIVLRDRIHGRTSFTVTPTRLNALPDSHEEEKDLVSVMFHCPLEAYSDAQLDWENSDIYATLSLVDLPPPADVFVPVTAIPRLDTEAHRSGNGSAAICLAPLTGDVFAPVMAHHMAHYQALGFSKYYIYLLDPGPKTLETLRGLVDRNPDGIELVRWGLPQGWKKSNIVGHHASRKFQVEPSLWNLPGVNELTPEVEFEMGDYSSGEQDVRLWYNGQTAALQDCVFRAMADGHRWTSTIDWDEYIFLKPAHGKAWPPAPTSRHSTPLTEWMYSTYHFDYWPGTIELKEANKLGLNFKEMAVGLRPAAFEFLSAFGCLNCAPRYDQPPNDTPALLDLKRKFPDFDFNRPGAGIPLPYVSPVRMHEFHIAGLRSKTIIDPWAWWSAGIHLPGLGFTEWAVTRGVCSSTFGQDERRGTDDALCARELLQEFGVGTSLVITPGAVGKVYAEEGAWPKWSGAPNMMDCALPEGMAKSELAQYGQGALMHYRQDYALTKRLNRFIDESPDQKWDLFSSDEARKVVNAQRVTFQDWARTDFGRPVEATDIVQDWSMLEIMAPTLLDIMQRKQKLGLRSWLGKSKLSRTLERITLTIPTGGRLPSDWVSIVLIIVWLLLARIFLLSSFSSVRPGGARFVAAMKEMQAVDEKQSYQDIPTRME
ncbi:BQ5605_C003g02484 [Microbotryum silenes-dioicae]|uniref:BQ5605_C003g02484 protein n=1 Tax=Microbotryum silenes-dioicae TaxID=796604 RepID=A0A2X0M5A1_9BASI|nr:BQ5605_C003g02484 [Microbotryum silenes-dioicae]